MNSNDLVVLGWLLLIVAGVVMLVLLGSPKDSRDAVLWWHMWLTTAVAVIEPIGLLLARFSTWPLVAIYVVSQGIMWWRIALLLQTRRGVKVKIPEEES